MLDRARIQKNAGERQRYEQRRNREQFGVERDAYQQTAVRVRYWTDLLGEELRERLINMVRAEMEANQF